MIEASRQFAMPYPLPRPIPSLADRDGEDHVFSTLGGLRPRSVSPTKNVGNRRRSSTIKSTLFSIFGAAGGSGSHQRGSSLPRSSSTLSVGCGETAVEEDEKSRRKSAAGGELGCLRHSRGSFNGAISAPSSPEQSSANEAEEGTASTSSCQRDGVVDGTTVGGNSTTCSSTSNPSRGSLKSFGREFLCEYLTERGLLAPKIISETPDIRISIATSGDHVFLPTMSSSDDEYLARLNGLRSDEEEAVEVEPDALQDRPLGNTPDVPSHSLPGFSDSTSLNDERAIEDDTDDASDELPGGLETGGSDTRTCQRMSSLTSTSVATPAFEIDNSMATCTMAVILSFPKVTTLGNIRGELCSRVRVYWHNGVPPTKSFYEEFYCAGSLEWELNTNNANLYVPLNVSSDEKIIENNRNLRPMKLFKNNSTEMRPYLDKNQTRTNLLKKVKLRKSQVFQPGDYVFIIPVVFSNHIPETLYMPSARVDYRFRIATKISSDDQTAVPGTDMDRGRQTETDQPSGRRFSNAIKKFKNNLHVMNQAQTKSDELNEIYSEYPIDVVRTPPLISISTANKPVYINRVWANSLSYEISFGQKYVPLGSKVPVKIKLAPMCKGIYLKRLRVSVIEKITFVSKNYEYEYDQIDPVAKDPYNPYFSDFASRRKKERNISLLEVRTSEKGSRAIREEIVENCINDNLLAYAAADSDDGQPIIGIAEPLMVETVLEFPRYEDLNKKTARTVPPYGIDVYTSVPNPEAASHVPTHRSGVMGFLVNRRPSLTHQSKGSSDSGQLGRPQSDENFHETTLRSNSGIPVQFHTNLNKTKRGLYLDSLNFSNIYSKHKLEFMLRISKIDDTNPKRLRHYEVLIDTPVFLVSELCNNGNMELPTYDMAIKKQPPLEADADAALPPTFEEAISVPGSPIQSPIVSPFGSPNVRSRYDADDLSIQQLSLSRSNSIAGPSETIPSSSHQMSLSHPMEANTRFNNLDGILSTNAANNTDSGASSGANEPASFVTSQEPTHGSGIFKSRYSLTQNSGPPKDDEDHGGTSEEEIPDSGPTASPPPGYDEVIPLMSDEE
ncbi:hypothetical protein HG536_0B04240 [Torulaspora globosa]|uniref:Arrestin C-terminal-like domain-containing protein n=1 Tax=Torulaspora globosa TaxID=48254 RepID=A0A7G3ZDH4_9SACH|nr:uncharacterized protein HG536_0B04240 [Torulaspora globosa]QLL31560.1 hypothetical protein HG536_0B04240 [Torulaspora globosa]